MKMVKLKSIISGNSMNKEELFCHDLARFILLKLVRKIKNGIPTTKNHVLLAKFRDIFC